ncbi:MAG: (Fe-S)-binding protein [Methanomassiliicoccales archaeon]
MNGVDDTENLRRLQKAMMTCTYCGFCKSVCPTYEGIGWDTSVARGRIILSYGLLMREIDSDASVMKSLYQCTTCKECERRCPSGIEVVDIVESARRALIASGKVLPPHQRVIQNVRNFGNPYSESRRVQEIIGEGDRGAELGYFAGCTAAYRNTNIALATTSILRKMKERFVVTDAGCCGSVLQRIGLSGDEIKAVMERNVEGITARGVNEVVFSCAGCYRMFKEEYPRHVKVDFKVKHVTEFLAERDVKIRPFQGKLTYHDPCHLGRHMGVYDAPRRILARIPKAEVIEMQRHRETARCCGGGGGVRSAFPELSEQIAAQRMKEASFADVLTTTCPFCVNNLSRGRDLCASRTQVLDLMEFLEPLVEERT